MKKNNWETREEFELNFSYRLADAVNQRRKRESTLQPVRSENDSFH